MYLDKIHLRSFLMELSFATFAQIIDGWWREGSLSCKNKLFSVNFLKIPVCDVYSASSPPPPPDNHHKYKTLLNIVEKNVARFP